MSTLNKLIVNSIHYDLSTKSMSVNLTEFNFLSISCIFSLKPLKNTSVLKLGRNDSFKDNNVLNP